MTNPLIMLTTFTMIINAIHIHIDIDTAIAGGIFTKQTTTRTKLAMLSRVRVARAAQG